MNVSPGQKLTLRPMIIADAEAVGAIDARAFGAGGWPTRAFLAELQENRLARYFVVVANEASSLMGYVGCWMMADAVHIVTIAVEPGQQRRGIGELLVLRALDLAAEAGAPAVTLECRASNTPAQALYGKYGFAVVGRRRRYYSNREDALVMTASGVCGAAFRGRLEERRTMHTVRHAHRLTFVSE